MKITVDQYHRMIDAGILQSSDRVELLRGYLVKKDRSDAGEDPLSVGKRHARGIELLTDLNPKLKRLGFYIRIQLPVTLSGFDEPEPDGAIVRTVKEGYSDRHPEPGDIACLIEVADSSLGIDRSVKQQTYADAGVKQYVIVNLSDDVVEEYSEPEIGQGRYARVTPYSRRMRIELRLGSKTLLVSVSALLP